MHAPFHSAYDPQMQRLILRLVTFVLCTQAAASFWFVSIAFLKRCDLEGQVLKCEELKEFKEAPASSSGGPGAAPDDSATPPADATTTPPADDKAAPADKKPAK